MQFSIARSFYASAYRAMRLGEPVVNQNHHRRDSAYVALRNAVIAQYGMIGQKATISFGNRNVKPKYKIMRYHNQLQWYALRKREGSWFRDNGL